MPMKLTGRIKKWKVVDVRLSKLSGIYRTKSFFLKAINNEHFSQVPHIRIKKVFEALSFTHTTNGGNLIKYNTFFFVKSNIILLDLEHQVSIHTTF